MTFLDKPSRPPLHPEAPRSEGKTSCITKIDLDAFEEDDLTKSTNSSGVAPTMKVVIQPSRLGKLSPIVEELGRSESSDTAWRSVEQTRVERASPFLGSESALEPIQETRDDEVVTEAETTEEKFTVGDKESSVTLKFSNRFEPRSSDQSAKVDDQREDDEGSPVNQTNGSILTTSISGGPVFQKAALKLKEKRKIAQCTGESIDPIIEPTNATSSDAIGPKQNIQNGLTSLFDKAPFDEISSKVDTRGKDTDVDEEAKNRQKVFIGPENHRRSLWNQSFWPQDASTSSSVSIDSMFQKAIDPDGQLQRAMSPPLVTLDSQKQSMVPHVKEGDAFESSTKTLMHSQKSVLINAQDGDKTTKLCVEDASLKTSEVAMSEQERQERIAALRAQRIKRQDRDGSPAVSEAGTLPANSNPEIVISKHTDSHTKFKLFSVDPPSSSEIEDPRMARLLALRAKRQSMLSSQNFFRHLDGIVDHSSSNSDDSKQSETRGDQEVVLATKIGRSAQPSSMNVDSRGSSPEMLHATKVPSPLDGVRAHDTECEEKGKDFPVVSTDVAVELRRLEDDSVQKIGTGEPEVSLTEDLGTIPPTHASNELDVRPNLESVGSKPESVPVINVEEDDGYIAQSPGYGTDASGTMEVIDVISVGTSDCTIASGEQEPIIIVQSDEDSASFPDKYDQSTFDKCEDARKACIECDDSRVIRITPSLEKMKEPVAMNLVEDIQGHRAEPFTIDLVSLVNVNGREGSERSHLRQQADPPSLSDIEASFKKANNKRQDPEQVSCTMFSQDIKHVEKAQTKGSRHVVSQLLRSGEQQSHGTADESSKNSLEIQSIIDLIRMEEEIEDQRLHEDETMPTETYVHSPKTLESMFSEPMSPVITESRTPEVHDSPFENVRRRLVQLNIEDFRTVVMEGVKTRDKVLSKHVTNELNEDNRVSKATHSRNHIETKQDSSHTIVPTSSGVTSNDREAPSKKVSNDDASEPVVSMATKKEVNPRVLFSGPLSPESSNSKMMRDDKIKTSDRKAEEKVRKSAERESNKSFDDTILNELADLESVSNPTPQPNLSSTIESILEKREKNSQRAGSRSSSCATDSFMEKADDDSSLRSGRRQPNMHVRFGDSNELGLKSDLTEPYMDLNVQDDGTNASTKSLETMDSDLDTLYESSTVPLLVRMLDRGCAWLEESHACGADTKPSLLSESRVPHVDTSKKRLGRRNKTHLPTNLPKSAPRSSKRSVVKDNATVSPKHETKSTKTDGEQSSKQGTKTVPSHKSIKKIRKGPRSRKKARNIFALPLLKSGVNGEYKLSSGFFSKASDSSSLATSTDSSSYENPIRVDGIVETSSDSQDGGGSRFEKYKALKLQQNFQTRSMQRSVANIDADSCHNQIQNGPPSPERGRVVSSKRALQFSKNDFEANDKASVIDVTDMRVEKAEMTLSPRMQGLPPTPTGSNISRTFQDKLQQRLTRVRDASSLLAEDNSGESSKESEGFYERRRDPVEESRRTNDELRRRQDPPEDRLQSRKSASPPSRQNQKPRTPKKATQSSPPRQLESTKVEDPINEAERLAAFALAEKLRLRASELKEKRRKNTGNRAAGTSSQTKQSQPTQI